MTIIAIGAFLMTVGVGTLCVCWDRWDVMEADWADKFMPWGIIITLMGIMTVVGGAARLF